MKVFNFWNVAIAVLLAGLMAGLLLPRVIETTGDPVVEGRRIISFSPALTETLFELGAGDEVIGVDTWSFKRSQVKEARERGQLMNLGNPFTGVHLETIVRLRPTLILHEETTTGANLNPLKDGSAQLVAVPFASLDDILAAYRTVGKLVERPAEAELLVAKVQAHMATPATDLSPRVILFNVFYPNDEDLSAAAGRSYQSQILERLGADNIFRSDDRTTRLVGPQEVVTADPDLIILLGTMPHGVTQDHYLSRFEAIRAIRTGSVHTISNDEALQQGPAAVERLARELRRIISQWDEQQRKASR